MRHFDTNAIEIPAKLNALFTVLSAEVGFHLQNRYFDEPDLAAEEFSSSACPSADLPVA